MCPGLMNLFLLALFVTRLFELRAWALATRWCGAGLSLTLVADADADADAAPLGAWVSNLNRWFRQ